MSEFKSPALKAADSVRPVAPRPVKPSGILHFTLSVTDLDRARRFYEDVVGATFWRQERHLGVHALRRAVFRAVAHRLSHAAEPRAAIR